MNDPDALLAARLADQSHRNDWWNIPGEHTPYEWQLQRAMERVQPTGETRADIRAANNTLALIASQAMKQLSEAELSEMFESLALYLKVNRPQEQVLSPEQAARMMGR